MGAAAELIPYGIVVNAIAPGPVATAMLGRKEGDTLYTIVFRAKRFATPSEIGQLAVIMVSDMCDLVIGDVSRIRVDDYTGKKMTFFHDPDGLPLELHE